MGEGKIAECCLTQANGAGMEVSAVVNRGSRSSSFAPQKASKRAAQNALGATWLPADPGALAETTVMASPFLWGNGLYQGAIE